MQVHEIDIMIFHIGNNEKNNIVNLNQIYDTIFEA